MQAPGRTRTHGRESQILNVIQSVDDASEAAAAIVTGSSVAGRRRGIIRPGKTVSHDLIDGPVSPLLCGCCACRGERERTGHDEQT